MDFLEDESGVFGVNLGADFTTEHEIGISGIREAFGMPNPFEELEHVGLEARTIRQKPDLLVYKLSPPVKTGQKGAKKKATKSRLTDLNPPTVPDLLILTKYRSQAEQFRPANSAGMLPYVDTLKRYPRYKEDYPVVEFVGAWDHESFGLAAYTDKAKTITRALVEAFEKKDVALWVGGTGGNPFARGGLCLAIPSRVPQKYKEEMLEADQNRVRLVRAGQATGIEKLLKKAGKEWFALDPRWASGFKTVIDPNNRDSKTGKEVKTTHEVVYWLNPREQWRYNSGYFTVEELELWAKNEGPVLKKGAR